MQISVASFVLALAPNLTQAAYYLAPRTPFQYGQLYFLAFALELAVFPVLTFAVFHYIGKKTEAMLKMRSIVIALLIGNVTASLVGSTLLSASTMTRSTVVGILVGVLALLVFFMASQVFAGLAGLSLGHLGCSKPDNNNVELAEPRL